MFYRIKNPVTRKRLARFKEVRYAWISFLILCGLYLISLGAELICNNKPLLVRFQGRSYFPVFFFYPEETFVKGGRKTRPDYKALAGIPEFRDDPSNFMVFAPIPYGPYESVDPASIPVSKDVTARLVPMPAVGSVNVDRTFSIVRFRAFESFAGGPEGAVLGKDLRKIQPLTPGIIEAVKARFENEPAPLVSEKIQDESGRTVQVFLSRFEPRKAPPKSVRLIFREMLSSSEEKPVNIRFAQKNGTLDPVEDGSALMPVFSPEDRTRLLEQAQNRLLGPVEPFFLAAQGRRFRVEIFKEEVRFPYPSVEGHWMGIDAAGRDVLARILYGLRTSLTFGLLLVAGSMALGIFAGAVQGYYGGVLDITAQRIIEIWSALPFLYIMILMGSVYGRSFSLLLFCYGLFNWIGISYYVRGEFLRLRRQAFVEAARCMGISTPKILFRHILPNALVPVITFFPFSLVGAIGALAALDYLGFGLPPPTPSWGELLFQAQQYRWAWWLILYPSCALFTVMLLGVFIGEGVRNAYDPKRYARME